MTHATGVLEPYLEVKIIDSPSVLETDMGDLTVCEIIGLRNCLPFLRTPSIKPRGGGDSLLVN